MNRIKLYIIWSWVVGCKLKKLNDATGLKNLYDIKGCAANILYKVL
jgi:hypothetical protein